jgi:hypothetical protein
MHPDILRQLAAEHTRDLITEAGEARRAREARHTQRRRLAAHLRRSTRLAAQQPGRLPSSAAPGWVDLPRHARPWPDGDRHGCRRAGRSGRCRSPANTHSCR